MAILIYVDISIKNGVVKKKSHICTNGWAFAEYGEQLTHAFPTRLNPLY